MWAGGGNNGKPNDGCTTEVAGVAYKGFHDANESCDLLLCMRTQEFRVGKSPADGETP